MKKWRIKRCEHILGRKGWRLYDPEGQTCGLIWDHNCWDWETTMRAFCHIIKEYQDENSRIRS